MKILALIPARGGSKRLPGKNIRPLGGKPLIAWSIEVVRGIPDIAEILVSTDDPAIAEVARQAGASVPWLRPAELASDTSSSADAALHALDCFEREHGSVDGVLLLQPTSPFRSRETVLRGIEAFRDSNRCVVVGVSPAASHPMWCFRVDGDRARPFIEGGGLHLRSQDLPAAYAVNGAFYLVSPQALRATRSFYDEHMYPLIIDDVSEAVDIDTEEDWLRAEAILAARAGQARQAQ
ncbi:cytidylyltransferase domain-containing protein [Herbaspirillum chlorophenolicum]|uniref:Cytidylyltransferase domain-containing protein n=1 Tax=Herbaspirillum chlorophenolicum TaxID=211589 RepID=A0ABW8EU18_9BURK